MHAEIKPLLNMRIVITIVANILPYHLLKPRVQVYSINNQFSLLVFLEDHYYKLNDWVSLKL